MRHLAAIVAVVAAGCAAFQGPPPRPKPPPVAAPSPADRLVAALDRVVRMDERGRAGEATRAKHTAAGDPDDFARLEAALALSVASPPDDEAVLALVAPVLQSPVPAMRAMAGFLQGMSLERQKLREGLAAASAKARDDRRDAHAQKLRADAQQDRADRLQQKLEALTNLEKSLADRNYADDPDRRPR
jgi:hypothetical protein